MKYLFSFICFTFSITFLQGQSPNNLTSNVTGLFSFSTVTAIENSFNTARRQEEVQLGLAVNSITNLDLPDQTTWNTYSADQKMLYILNDERTSRTGINYGSGPVRGLPFQGVEQTVDIVAQNYAQLLYNNSAFSHTFGGTDPFGRIATAVGTNCRSFLSRGENLAYFGGSSNSFPDAVEKSIFLWNYQDACCSWGHRAMNLHQSFTNDNGEVGQEGFIGIGVAEGSNYNGFPGVIVVLNYYDPVADANAINCNYNVTVTTNSLLGNTCESAVTATATNGNADISAINTIASSGTVNVTGTVTYNAGTSITLNSGFHAQAGSNFTAKIEACMDALITEEIEETQRYRPSVFETTLVAPTLAESTIFPNPYQDHFTLQYHLATTTDVDIEVFNVRGQKLIANSLTNQPEGLHQLRISGADWTKGIYLVKIKVEERVWTKRVVKQ